jgi:hypothetical protein
LLVIDRVLVVFVSQFQKAYFCGHDHNTQHLVDNAVEYYLTGAGHTCNHSTVKSHRFVSCLPPFEQKNINNVPKNSLKYHWPTPEDCKNENEHGTFLTVVVEENIMTVKYIRDDGKVLYTTQKQNPRRQ